MATARRHCPKDRERAAGSAADLLGLSAAPAFAVMAILTAAAEGDAQQVTCLDAAGGFAGGMVWMYVLMSVVHTAPWLRLISRRERSAERN